MLQTLKWGQESKLGEARGSRTSRVWRPLGGIMVVPRLHFSQTLKPGAVPLGFLLWLLVVGSGYGLRQDMGVEEFFPGMSWPQDLRLLLPGLLCLWTRSAAVYLALPLWSAGAAEVSGLVSTFKEIFIWGEKSMWTSRDKGCGTRE